MSTWPSSKARVVLRALLKIGWTPKPQKSGTSHLRLLRPGWHPYTWAWHDKDELGPKVLAKIAKQTGLKPEDL